MACGKRKVIDIKDAHLAKRMAKKEINNQLISQGRQILSTSFSKILKSFFEKIDDELFVLSDKAENSTLQATYFDAMRYVRKERSRMQNNYLKLIERGYDDFWAEKAKSFAASDQTENDEFSLVENEMLEEDLAIVTMTDKGENRYYSELYALNKRFAALLNADEVSKEQNPVAPAQLCQAFRSTLDPLTLDLEIKLVIYKIFDRLVLSNVGAIYVELNSLLISQGVLPKIQKKIRKQGSSSSAKPGGMGADADKEEFNGDGYSGEIATPEEMSSEQLEFFRSLQNLIGVYRQRHDGGYSVGSVGSGPAYEMNEVMDVLSMAQSNITGNASPLPHGENLKVYLADSLRGIQPGGDQRPFASMDEDVIDMVGMIFDYILEDKNLPDTVKALLGRLQIPMLKVAILDKGFFARKGHPARELLNRLSKAGGELSNDDCELSNPVFAEIEAIVEQILNGFDQNSELFEELLAEFAEFLERDENRCQVLEERTLQVTESKEKILLAKKQTAYEMAKQMQGKRIPSVVKDFIEDSWKGVIMLAALRAGREPEGMERAVSVVGRLIESVTPPSSVEEKQRILGTIPLLLKEVRIGLENISVDSHEMAKFFKDLEQCHIASLKGTHEAEQDVIKDVVVLPSKSEEEIEQACDEILEEIVVSGIESEKFEGSVLSEKSDFDTEEIILASDPVVKEEVLEDEFLEKAKALDVGQWVEVDRDEKSSRLKLSWKSQVTSMYVFVDRKGAKVLELSLQGVAAELRRSGIRLIEEASLPLMDRALAAMMTTLKASPVQPETATH
jgi:hypothetical protein